jgi:hypothetical protein
MEQTDPAVPGILVLMSTISFFVVWQSYLSERIGAIFSFAGTVFPSPMGIRSVYLSMHPVIREISPAPETISLILSLISGHPG